jgi:hypothetical protein
MKASEALKETWAAVAMEASHAEGYYHRRIPLAAPWPAHAGVHRPTDARILNLETDAKSVRGLPIADETRGYAITIASDDASRADRAVIRIKESPNDFREIFAVFCADLLEHWLPHAIATDALKALVVRLARWRRFFQRGAQAGLSREDYIGLYGELSLIEAGLNAGLTSVPLIESWQGPIGTNQDFLFGPTAVEIKTTTNNELDKVRITNVRQLDPTGLRALFLVHYAFDFRQGTGRTLPQLIEALRSMLASASAEALSTLNDRLIDAGCLDGTPNEFDSWGFAPRHFDIYAVTDGFPLLLESGLPPGVCEVSYAVNLSVAAHSKSLPSDFWRNISSCYA